LVFNFINWSILFPKNSPPPPPTEVRVDIHDI
jgi:hypothetical protein